MSMSTPAAPPTHDQPIRQNSEIIPTKTFNSVVFANHSNESAATTHVVSEEPNFKKHHHQLSSVSVIHEYEPNPTKKQLPNYSEIPSPSDSFHSVLSRKHSIANEDGIINSGFVGSHHNVDDTGHVELRPRV